MSSYGGTVVFVDRFPPGRILRFVGTLQEGKILVDRFPLVGIAPVAQILGVVQIPGALLGIALPAGGCHSCWNVTGTVCSWYGSCVYSCVYSCSCHSC